LTDHVLNPNLRILLWSPIRLCNICRLVHKQRRVYLIDLLNLILLLIIDRLKLLLGVEWGKLGVVELEESSLNALWRAILNMDILTLKHALSVILELTSLI